MSESGSSPRELNARFGYDFEPLAGRLTFTYGQLHDMAHADKSPHHEREEIRMSVVLDGEIRTVHCSVDEYEWMRVRIQDSQGDKGYQYRCSLKTERKHAGGKHRAGGEPVYEDPSRRGLPQTETMIVMADILESCYEYLVTQDGGGIEAHEK